MWWVPAFKFKSMGRLAYNGYYKLNFFESEWILLIFEKKRHRLKVYTMIYFLRVECKNSSNSEVSLPPRLTLFIISWNVETWEKQLQRVTSRKFKFKPRSKDFTWRIVLKLHQNGCLSTKPLLNMNFEQSIEDQRVLFFRPIGLMT